MTKVISYCTYDLLHQGHINLLRRVKELGDYLIIGVTSDSFDRAGLVPMLAFLNGPMVTSTQRDLTTEQEKGNRESFKVNLTADQRI